MNGICKICNKNYKNLGNHLHYNHKEISGQKYYNLYLKQPNEGICIECGKPTHFINTSLGYRKFCSVSCSRTNKDTQLKYKNTCKQKYGNENPFSFGSINFKNKIKEKYNVDNISQCEEIKKQKENTFLQHFGVKNTFGIKSILNKAIVSSQSDSAWNKRHETYKRNHRLSKLEILFEEKCKENNIEYITQYKEERYPYHCDFYLPKLDMFIEIHGHWTHGGHLFDKNNQNDIITLNVWKEKSKNNQFQHHNFWNTAINVWTKLDLSKVNIAKQNNLNYIILWNTQDIYDFFSNLRNIMQ